MHQNVGAPPNIGEANLVAQHSKLGFGRTSIQDKKFEKQLSFKC